MHKVVFDEPLSHRPSMAPKMAIGVPSMTPMGKDQLSYWAARIRNTNSNAIPNTSEPEPAAAFS